MTTAPKGKKRRSEKKDSNWPYILPIVLLAILAFASYAWRQQQNAQSATQSQAFRLTTVANQQATAEAIALIPTATSIPTSTPLPTATSVPPTEAPPALPAPTETVPPTATAIPTATPEPLLTATATATPLPTPTAQPVTANITVRQGQSSLRRGPSREYSTITLVDAGQTLVATGRTADEAWILVCCIGDAPGWLADELLNSDIALSELPIADAPSVLARPDGRNVPIFSLPNYGNETGEIIEIGSMIEVTGRARGNAWLRICCTDSGESGWVPSITVAVDGIIDTVDIVEAE